MAFLDENGDGIQPMDVEQPDMYEQERLQYSGRSNFLGPYSLYTCMHFIMMSTIVLSLTDQCVSYLNDVFQIILSKDEMEENEIATLQAHADNYLIDICLCSVSKNHKTVRDINSTTIKDSQQQSHCAYLVFDESEQSFYAFYIDVGNNKSETIFLKDDQNIRKLFEQTIENKWPNGMQNMTQQSLSSIECEQAQAQNQSEVMLNASDVCSLLLNNMKDLVQRLTPQLDQLNFLFPLSRYRLHHDDCSSETNAHNSLTIQMQMLQKLSDLAIESLSQSFLLQSSIESDDANQSVQNESSYNSHDDDVSARTIHAETPLPSDSQSAVSIYGNISQNVVNILPQLFFPAPKLCNQPRRLWHNRTLEDLRDKTCPTVPAEEDGQRKHLKVEFPEQIKHCGQTTYVGCHVVTYDKKEHDQTLVVPDGTLVKDNFNLKTNDLDCLILGNTDEFDRTSKGVFSKIDPNNSVKEVLVKMVNLYEDHVITKDVIENRKLNWCRLKLAIYVKSSVGQFHPVSPFVYSDLIERTYGAQSMKTSSVFPNRICERGGQMIFVQLKQKLKKSELDLICNGKKFYENEFQISNTILSFESSARIRDLKHYNVVVINRNARTEMNFKLPYYDHVDGHGPCGVVHNE